MNRGVTAALFAALLLLVVGGGFFLMNRQASSLLGPQAAEQNPCDVFPSLDGALANWMRDQRKLEPALTCEHFELILESTPSVSPATAWEDASGMRAGAPKRWFDRDGRQLLLPNADRLGLVDLSTSSHRLLLDSQGGESWTDAGWMDPRSFVVAGRATGAVAGTTAPTLSVFRLDTNALSVFRGPSTPAP